MELQDRKEVDRVKANVEQCRKTLQSLGYADFTFEDFFAVSMLQLVSVVFIFFMHFILCGLQFTWSEYTPPFSK